MISFLESQQFTCPPYLPIYNMFFLESSFPAGFGSPTNLSRSLVGFLKDAQQKGWKYWLKMFLIFIKHWGFK